MKEYENVCNVFVSIMHLKQFVKKNPNKSENVRKHNGKKSTKQSGINFVHFKREMNLHLRKRKKKNCTTI